MNKREAQRQTQQENALMSLGFTREESVKLRRISMTLRRWHEQECGIDHGCIERDETTGKAMWRSALSGKAWQIVDRETGAKKRLQRIIDRRNMHQAGIIENGKPIHYAPVSAYIQGDPRGAALYIIRPGDIPAGLTVDSCYTRGIVVY